MSELCRRIIALRLEEQVPTVDLSPKCDEHKLSAAVDSPVNSMQGVRHPWAPQFRPHRLPLPSQPIPIPHHTMDVAPSRYPQTCSTPSAFSMSPSAHETQRKEHRFSLSAFLDCPDPISRYPPKSRFLGSYPISRCFRMEPNHTPQSPTDMQRATASIPNWSDPTTDSKCSNLLVPQTGLVPRPAPSSSTHSASSLCSSAGSESLPAFFMTESTPLAKPVLMNAPAVIDRLQDTLVTAPPGSSQPFVNGLYSRVPPTMPENIFSNSMPPVSLDREPACHRPGPEVQRELREFLEMGHANPC
jgi:hypothetical protein